MTFTEDQNSSATGDATQNIKNGENRENSEGAENAVEELDLSVDSTMQLEADLASAKIDIAEWHDRYLRKAAEFDNYRKRVEKEKSELRIAAQSAILQELLPVVDGFARAWQFFGAKREGAGSIEQYHQGMELLYRQILDALEQAGATSIETTGKPFDPHMHEALSREETSEVEEGTVVRELRRGYMFKDRLLRPAQVIVSVQPKQENTK